MDLGEYFAFRATGLENGKTRDQLKAFNARLIKHGSKNNSKGLIRIY